MSVRVKIHGEMREISFPQNDDELWEEMISLVCNAIGEEVNLFLRGTWLKSWGWDALIRETRSFDTVIPIMEKNREFYLNVFRELRDKYKNESLYLGISFSRFTYNISYPYYYALFILNDMIEWVDSYGVGQATITRDMTYDLKEFLGLENGGIMKQVRGIIRV